MNHIVAESQPQIYGYECPIKNVTGNSNVKIQNKNLLPELWFTQNRKTISNNGVTATINIDNTITLTGTATERTLLYFTPFNLKFGAGTYQYISNSNANLRIESTLITDGTIAYANSFNNTPFERTAQESFEITGSVIIIAEGQATNTTLYFFVQEKNIDTSYVLHQEQNYPFTFAQSQRGMQGTTLQDDGIHNKHKQRVFDGTENFNVNPNYTTENILCVQITINDVKPTSNQCLCSHFKYYSLSTIKNVFRFAGNFLLFTVDRNEYATLEDFKTKFANEYANGTPVILEYELEEEEIIPYTATQQAQYNAMKNAKTYKDKTYITTNSDELPPKLKIQYWEEKQNTLNTNFIESTTIKENKNDDELEYLEPT